MSYTTIIIIILAFIASRIITSTPEHIGKVGEDKIAKDLGRINFFGYDGYCLRNVYVPHGNGNTTEIDLLYITEKGFFVIESKNYSGYIFGNDRYQEWTSTLYGGHKVNKYKFYNPIWQNRTHIKALREYLNQDIVAYSVIVFGNNCEIKSLSYDESEVVVCYESKLKKTIKKIWANAPDIYNKSQTKNFYRKLIGLTGASKEVKAKHISDIKNGASKSSSLICPRCGNVLVERTAKRGIYAGNKFYGCSNYPRCKYIQNK